MSKSTAKRPAKPHPDFPLWLHPSGRWCKKIRGRAYYFGKADDPQGALERYLAVKDDLLAGRTPRVSGAGVSVKDLVNRFLTSKQQRVDTRELAPRSFADYYRTCAAVVKVFGPERLVSDLAADDFERLRTAFARTHGPVALSNDITRARVLFKYGFDSGLLSAPVRYGQGFNRPSKKTLRLTRKNGVPRMFDAKEILTLIGAAGVQLRAMIYLGVNCGFGNQDCATVPLEALDLDAGWITYHRPKTGIDRRCPLWPQTTTALREAIAARPAPKEPDADGLVFVTRTGVSWSKETMDNPVAKEFAKVLKALGMQRKGRGFYALRHTFETIAGDSRDQVAVNYIMGHAPAQNDMASVYRERIDDARLVAVAAHVRQWLFGSNKTE